MTLYVGPWKLDSPTTQLTDKDFSEMESAGGVCLSKTNRRDIQQALDRAERVWRVTYAERPDTDHPDRMQLAKSIETLRQSIAAVRNGISDLDDHTAVMILVDRDHDFLDGSPPGTEPFAHTVAHLLHTRADLLSQLLRIDQRLVQIEQRAKVGLREGDRRPRRRPKDNAPLHTLFLTLASVFEQAGGRVTRAGRVGPWARFLHAVWTPLPQRPFKPASRDAFVQAALEALREADKRKRRLADERNRQRQALRSPRK